MLDSLLYSVRVTTAWEEGMAARGWTLDSRLRLISFVSTIAI
jgi:hypothetical protein